MFYLAAVVGRLTGSLYGNTTTSIISVEAALEVVAPPRRPIRTIKIVCGKFQLGFTKDPAPIFTFFNKDNMLNEDYFPSFLL
jgi:hypothetical protein